MTNINFKRLGTAAMEAVYVIALNCAVLSLVALVSVSGASVRDILIGGGVNMTTVYSFIGSLFAAGAVLSAASAFAVHKLGA